MIVVPRIERFAVYEGMSVPLRVLHVSSGNLYGGIETLLRTLARRRDLFPEMEAEFALCFRGRLFDELTEAGVAVHDLGQVRFRYPWTTWRARARMKRLLSRSHFDIVICHGSWPYALFAPPVRSNGRPVALQVHGPVYRPTWLDRLAFRTDPDLMIGVSHYVLQTAGGMVKPRHSGVIHNLIPWDDRDVGTFDRLATRSEFDTASDATLVISVNRLDPWKGHEDLLSALARLKDVPNWVFWQVGGPQRPGEDRYFESLKQQAAASGLADRVKFLGVRKDVPRLLAAADVFAQANRESEGFSMVFMEAMSSALPVVTTDLGSAREMFDESCSFLTPPREVGTFASALRTLIRDSGLRRRMGTAAVARIRSVSDPATQLSRYHALLARSLKNDQHRLSPHFDVDIGPNRPSQVDE